MVFNQLYSFIVVKAIQNLPLRQVLSADYHKIVTIILASWINLSIKVCNYTNVLPNLLG